MCPTVREEDEKLVILIVGDDLYKIRDYTWLRMSHSLLYHVEMYLLIKAKFQNNIMFLDGL